MPRGRLAAAVAAATAAAAAAAPAAAPDAAAASAPSSGTWCPTHAMHFRSCFRVHGFTSTSPSPQGAEHDTHAPNISPAPTPIPGTHAAQRRSDVSAQSWVCPLPRVQAVPHRRRR